MYSGVHGRKKIRYYINMLKCSNRVRTILQKHSLPFICLKLLFMFCSLLGYITLGIFIAQYYCIKLALIVKLSLYCINSLLLNQIVHKFIQLLRTTK